MSTELKGTKCRSGDVQMTKFYGGQNIGTCVQLTFPKPDYYFVMDHGWWWMTLTKEQALEMAAALIEFANDTREEIND